MKLKLFKKSCYTLINIKIYVLRCFNEALFSKIKVVLLKHFSKNWRGIANKIKDKLKVKSDG